MANTTLSSIAGTPRFQTVVEDWQAFTPSSTNGFLITTNNLRYCRVGSNIFITGDLTPNTVSAVEFRLGLPTGLSIGTLSANTVGVGRSAYASSSVANDFTLLATTGQTYLRAGYNENDIAINTLTASTANGILINATRSSFHAGPIPIAEWTGTGTFNAATGNDVEYAYNTSTSTSADDTTSFANGPQGAQIQNITATLTRRVRFQTPIQATDRLWVEVSTDQLKWIPLPGVLDFAGGQTVSPWTFQNTLHYGMGRLFVINSTDVSVLFGQYATQASAAGYGSAGVAWSTGTGSGYWRIVKTRAGIAVGFGAATATTTGLVTLSKYQQKSVTGDTYGDTGSNGGLGVLDSGLTFNNLVVGRAYRFTGRFTYRNDANTNVLRVQAFNNAVQISGQTLYFAASGVDYQSALSCGVFTAAATTVLFYYFGDSNARARGGNVVLEELNSHIVSTSFT